MTAKFQMNSSFVEGFWDGLGAGLFTRLRRPGAPDEPIDSANDELIDFARVKILLNTYKALDHDQTR